ncbi:MAG: epoxyqueuosine reductase [bacterium]|nr:MAG: epoxyqueuosine reductase [bacterium]
MSAEEQQRNLLKLREIATELGIDLFSSTRIDNGLREGIHRCIRELSVSLDNAVVIGMRLSEPVLQTVVTAPTWTYYYHYRIVNMALDQAVLRLSGECQRMGYRSLPIPASQILDWERLRAHVSHRELGARAGLGWWGRNNLLINERFGAQVRYASLLTDLTLPERGSDTVTDGCGDCTRCIPVCPVGAIQKDPAAFKLDRCAAQLRRFARDEKLNTMICGLCLKACYGEHRMHPATEGSTT